MRALLAISLLLFPLCAHAQTAEEARAAREAAERRVEADMVRMTSLVEALAKNLGQMHYLRTLCFGERDQQWRDYMARMLDVEAAGNGALQRELTQAFNAGYYQEQSRHSVCDNTVSADVAALAENGRSVARMLGDPYRETD
ncbi:MAG: TIGR02301 family protein [Pseudomonadota bacterium]